MTHRSSKLPVKFYGFTLIELLVTISIIAILIGILLPVLRAARIASQEVASKSNLRQIMIGYTLYQTDFDGHVLWGYPPPSIEGVTIQVRVPGSETSSGRPALITDFTAQRYPYRLMPYVGWNWNLLYNAQEVPEEDGSSLLDLSYFRSTSPDYGINSVFVGGWASQNPQFSALSGFYNTGKGGGVFGGASEWKVRTDAHVAFRSHEIQNPGRLVTFTDTETASEDKESGHVTVMPPKFGTANSSVSQLWTVESQVAKAATNGTFDLFGVPKGWYSDLVMSSFFDGHVQALSAPQLSDMKFWANDPDIYEP